MRPGDLAAYCPDAGDIIWLDFLQAIANEQAGRRPALVVSPRAFNELTGRCVACPITRRHRDWSFHVAISGFIATMTCYSDSSGFSLALTSSSTVAGALQIKRDPRFSQDTLRNWSA